MPRHSAVAVLLAALLLLPGAARGAEGIPERKPFSAETMWSLARLGPPSVSPDGKWAVLALTTFDVKNDKAMSELWLVPCSGGEARPLTSRGGADSSPAWSPDGRWIAFLGKRGDDESAQVYVIPVDGGEAKRLTSVPGGALVPRWFPDAGRVAFATWVFPDWKGWEDQARRLKERRESKMTARTWDRSPVRRWDRFLDERRAHLFTVPVSGGEPTPVTPGTGVALPFGSVNADPDRDDFDISPDGKEIAFAADSDRSGVEPNLDLYVVPAEGGAARNLTAANGASDSKPLYSPDGRTIAYGRQEVRRTYYDRVRLALYDRAAGTSRVVTEAWDRSVSGLVWLADGRSLLASIDDSGTRRVYRIDAVSGKPSPVTTAPSFTSLAVSGAGRTVVALRESFAEPPTLVRLDTRDGQATKLSTFNDAKLAGVDMGAFESVTYSGADGKPVQMWVTYPPGFERTRRYPLFLLLHGGPHLGMTNGFFWRWNAQVFSAWGYVTAWPNFHGSSGFGTAFTESIDPDWVTKPYQDVLAAASWLSSKPWIDPARMAAGGGSYGGYLATVLLGRPHPFRTLLVHAGVTDRYAQYASDVGAYRKRFGDFWEDEPTWRKVSPILAAGSFATPTLVIHGALDHRVPDGEGFELFNVLQARGVRSRLVHFPNENHWVLKPQNSLYWYQVVREWLREFVGEGTGPG